MVKKRQKDIDFQKVKLKVGRKLPKGTNVTKTDFKSKKIQIREVKDLGDNPLLSLSRNPSSNSKFKLLCLGKLKDQIFDDSTQINGETINILAKMMLEDDEKVRTQAIRNTKNYLDKLRAKCSDISPFLTILLGYSKCAITHLSPDVSSDAKDFLEYVIPKCDEKQHKQLMVIILARLSVASSPTAKDLELAALIAEKVLQKSSVQSSVFNAKQHTWSESHNFIDLSAINPRKPVTNYNISFQLMKEQDVVEQFIETIRHLVELEFNYFRKRKSNDLSISLLDARRLIAYLKMSKLLRLNCDDIVVKLKQLTVVEENNRKMAKKDVLEFNAILKRLDKEIETSENNS